MPKKPHSFLISPTLRVQLPRRQLNIKTFHGRAWYLIAFLDIQFFWYFIFVLGIWVPVTMMHLFVSFRTCWS